MSKKKRAPIPKFDTPIIETHCHLDYLDVEHLTATLDAAAAVGVEKVVTIAVSADNQSVVRNLVELSPMIWGTQGIHPHEAEQWNNAVATEIRAGAEHERIVAIGEIGLDYFYDHADRAAQALAFEAQLAMAVELDLPVVIHTREADDDTRAILANFSGQLKRGGVIHSFTSGIPLAEYCIEEGFYIGFNGITTFKNADNVRAVVEITPFDHLVLETDAPYLTPIPYRGVVNAPCYLPFIAEKVAEVKKIAVEPLLQYAYQNSLNLFFPQP
ncbi:TatD family hydrolase [Paraglaciecola sp.]|nr:TatD family hydrolase [Paraglaciecola sp.]MDB4281876.1 TatD family hydrolase [Paraglaciecola sp.]